MGTPRIHLLTGFLPSIDREPKVTRIAGTKRVAFVLDTYHPASVNAELDRELYSLVIQGTFEASGAAALAVDGGGASRESLPEFLTKTRQLNLENLPERVVLTDSAGVRTAVIDCHPWWKVGGPEPYHDSCTLAVYVTEHKADKVEDAVRAKAKTLNIEIPPTTKAEPLARRRGLFVQLLGKAFGFRR